MERLRIYYSFRGNGISFVTSVSDYENFKSLFPDAQPARSVFIEYDWRSNFKENHPQLENYVLPALTGFPNLDKLKQIKDIQFILTPEMKITYAIKNESEIQPVYG